MKRFLPTTAATLVGFGAVMALHTATNKNRTAIAPPASSATTTTQPATAGPNGAQAATTTSPPGPSNPGPSSVGAGPTKTVTGPAENYGYGILAVKVTMAGGRITDVALAGLRVAESYSQMLAQQVVPMLRQEVLAAQGTRVNTISGATYTSEAYLVSLQSALSKARA